MAFSGLSTNEHFTNNEIQEDVSRLMRALAPKETSLLDWLGDSDVFAANIKHEWFDDYLLPNKIVNSTAINSATADTGIQINGLGQALTVGTLLEIEGTDGNSTTEVMQVKSVVGANSVLVSRNYEGTGVGSLAAGGSIFVRAFAGVEGEDHSGSSVRRHGDRKTNTVGLFRAEVSVSDTDAAINGALYGDSSFDAQIRKAFIEMRWGLEKEALRGKLNTSNSLATSSTTRTMQGLRAFITTVNSTVTASSFATNPHLYIGNIWQNVYDQYASAYSETWAIVCGTTFFRDISNLNDTKVYDSNEKEEYKRVIRRYTGPLGSAEVILGRALGNTELLLIPRERIKVVPLQGRSFDIKPMAKTGDNEKVLLTGEYTMQVHHPSAMARLRV